MCACWRLGEQFASVREQVTDRLADRLLKDLSLSLGSGGKAAVCVFCSSIRESEGGHDKAMIEWTIADGEGLQALPTPAETNFGGGARSAP